MPDTQPNFTVSFKELAVSAIKRQTRGNVILVLNSENEKTYKSFSEVNKDDFSEAECTALELCFMGSPKKVIVLKKEENIAERTKKLDKYDNYILCYPEMDEEETVAVKNYLKLQREKNNYSIGMAANTDGLDAEYMINFVSASDISISSGTKTKKITPKDYLPRIAGALAGLSQSRSLTYFELNEVVDVDIADDLDKVVKNGGLTIIHQDGSFKLGRAVNSLVTLTDGVTEAFQKIRIVNIMDMIANDIITTFRTNYVGKYVNNYANKKRFIGAVNTYLKDLASNGLLDEENDNLVYLSYEKIKSFIEAKGVSTENMSYEEIIAYNTGSSILLDGVCSPTDCMEDLNLGFYLFQALESEE